jgi:hypothetical protein
VVRSGALMRTEAGRRFPPIRGTTRVPGGPGPNNARAADCPSPLCRVRKPGLADGTAGFRARGLVSRGGEDAGNRSGRESMSPKSTWIGGIWPAISVSYGRDWRRSGP